MMTCVSYMASHIVGRLADQGLANVAGLETFRHGTNPLSWASIHILGTLPSQGGGDSENLEDLDKSYFYVTTDKRREQPCSIDKKRELQTGTKPESYIETLMRVRTLPKSYAWESTNNLLQSLHVPKAISWVLSSITTIALPTIKFRFSNDQIEKMSTHVGNHEIARKTNEWISPLNIGVLGTITNCFSAGMVERIVYNQERMTGVAQLALVAVAVSFAVTYSPAFVAANSVSIVAGLALGLL